MRHTLRIWSPSSSPSLAAGLSSKTPATKIPTSFPPANRRPTLSPFLNLTSFMLGLGRRRRRSSEEECKGRNAEGESERESERGKSASCRMMLMKLNTQKLTGMSTQSTGRSSAKWTTMRKEVVLLVASVLPTNRKQSPKHTAVDGRKLTGGCCRRGQRWARGRQTG